jgi:hypothetical protein
VGADDEDLDETLAAYEHAKREQLANEGLAPLRRELAALTRFLESDETTPQLANVDVNEDFRRAKAQILQRILAEAQADED